MNTSELISRRRLLFFALFPSLLLGLLPARSTATDYYVDWTAQGANDGSTWSDAFVTLQDALAVAVSGDDVMVAEGVYFPDEGAGQTDGDTASSFVVPEGVDVSGGWVVVAYPDRVVRFGIDRERHPTILSGDLSQDDIDPEGNSVTESADQIVGVNARHVVTVPPGTVISNLYVLTITGGNAQGVGPSDSDGGGVHSSGALSLGDSRVIGNSADGAGGGVYLSSASGSIYDCLISGNSAGSTGGGVHCESSSPSISRVRLMGNTAQRGGGLSNNGSSPAVTASLITGIHAMGRGGAVVNRTGSNPSFSWCTLSGNSAGLLGGGVANNASDPTFKDVIVWNNRVGTSTTLVGASVENVSSTPTFQRCLIANSGGSSAWDVSVGDDLGENLDLDPLFTDPVDPALAPTVDGYFLPLPGSPVAEAGGSSGSSDRDVDGGDRSIDANSDGFDQTDIGAYEMPQYLYVDHTATGAGTGLNWTDAFVHLQDALASLDSGTEIRVAEGIYYPDEGLAQTNDDPDSTFLLGNEQGALVGGFPNGGGARDIENHPTVLSADIDGDDRDLDGNGIAESRADLRGQNAYGLITTYFHDSAAEPFRLDGVIVTAGNANAGSGSVSAGGLYAGNTAKLLVDRCTFSGNYAGAAGGGAVFSSGVTTLRFRHCRFTGNASSGNGGALFDRTSSVILDSCLFAGNSSESSGGAIYTTDGSVANRATSLDNCLFQGNVAASDGGAVDVTSYGACYAHSSTFSGNRAGNSQTNPFSGSGGALSVWKSNFKAWDSVFWNNESFSGPDTVVVSGLLATQRAAFGQCVIEGSGGSAVWDTSLDIDLGGNLDVDPDFAYPVHPRFAPTTVGNYRPLAGSALLDAGRLKHRPASGDLDDSPRIEAGRIDIGAYEGAFLPIYVDGAATGTNKGTSWANAYTHLTDAIAAATPGSVVLVAAGVYHPDEGTAATNNDPQASFQLSAEVALVGGFPNGGGVRDPAVNPTILSGDIDGDDIDPDSDGIVASYADLGGTNSYAVVSGAGYSIADTSIDGFVITAGKTSATTFVNGGGMRLSASRPTVFQCQLIGNQAEKSGGAIWFGNGASPSLIEVSCSGNSALSGGAMAAVSGSAPVLRRCTFSGNSGTAGGGVFSEAAFPEFYACVISANSASALGGGSRHIGGEGTYVNCVWLGNASDSGGALYSSGMTELSIINGTIAGNHSGSKGGGFYFDNTAATVANSIIWHNLADGSGIPILSNSVHAVGGTGANSEFSECLIAHGGQSGIDWNPVIGVDGGGNDEIDPQFALPPVPQSAPTALSELHVMSGSPALDQGDNHSNNEPFDLAGARRIGGVTIDIGAYEGAVDLADLDGNGIPDYWENVYFGSSIVVDPESDADCDLLTAFAEFVLGLDPLSANAPGDYLELTAESAAGTNYLTLRHRVNPAAASLVDYRVVRSIDLGTDDPWSTDDTVPVTSPEGWEGSRSSLPMSGQSREFLQLDLESTGAP